VKTATTTDTFAESIALAADTTDDPLVSAWLAALAEGESAASAPRTDPPAARMEATP
jgi:hypothetical protein